MYVEDSGEVGYTGFTHEWRDRQWDRAGPLIRTTEHGEHRARPHQDQGGGVDNKYVAWRRSAAGTHTSATVRRERALVAAEMEQQAITRLSLKGNQRKRRKVKARVIFRLRLPAWKRQADRHDMWRIRTQQKRGGRRDEEGEGDISRVMSRQEKVEQERRTRRRRQNAEWQQLKKQVAEEKTRGPLDTKEARRERKENVERRKIGRQTAERNLEKERWQEDFLTAYQAAQRRRVEYNGQMGPLDVYDRIADMGNVVAVKISQPVSLTSTMQLCQKLGDRLSMGPVNLDFLPLLSRHFRIDWSGQWNAEAVQTPARQIGNRQLAASAAGDVTKVDALARDIEPVLSHFFAVQAPVIRAGAHPWQHNRYYQWLGGGNGGLLPRDSHAPEGAIPVLDARAREGMRAAFIASGLEPTEAPEEQFVVGRAAWARGVRASDLSDLPYYSEQ